MRSTFTIIMTLLCGVWASSVYAAEGFFNAKDKIQTEPQTATDKIVNRFIELDLDETETVSFEEYMIMVQTRAEERFASIDKNQNGEASADEYRSFWKAQKSQYYRLKR
ncbi:MAG: hypothetical protein R8K49_03270 [Mariprofundaceae bacterium]